MKNFLCDFPTLFRLLMGLDYIQFLVSTKDRKLKIAF
jgi:hypothetical protein